MTAANSNTVRGPGILTQGLTSRTGVLTSPSVSSGVLEAPLFISECRFLVSSRVLLYPGASGNA